MGRPKKNSEIDAVESFVPADVVENPEENAAIAQQAKAEYDASKKSSAKVFKSVGMADTKSNSQGVRQVGDFQIVNPTMDAKTAKYLKITPAPTKGWIAMSEEDVVMYQEQGVLIGHNPLTGMGLLRKEEE